MKKILFEQLPLDAVVFKTIKEKNVIWLEEFKSGMYYKVSIENGKFLIFATNDVGEVDDE